MRKPTFSPEAWEDFLEWAETDVKVMRKILSLIDAAAHTPFDGIGKPEALKHNLKGYWSRRITKEHRLVYKVTDEEILIAECKNHY